jgi:hypothetical protein
VLCQAPEQSGQRLKELLAANDFAQAGTLVAAQPITDYPQVTCFLQQCPNCPSADRFLEVKRVNKNKKGEIETSMLVQGLLSPGELDDFKQQFPQSAVAVTEQATDV